MKRHGDSWYVLDVAQIVIRSSWIVVNGDVCTIDGRRANGKKLGPRKKRGKPISDAGRQVQQHRARRARDLRRTGFDTHPTID